MVVNHNNFNLTLRLTNNGDDSFNTKLYLYYPPGLSFSMLNRLTVREQRPSSTQRRRDATPALTGFFCSQQSSRPTLPSCKDLEGVLNETMCGINLPVYHSGTHVSS